jgi:ferredoxin
MDPKTSPIPMANGSVSPSKLRTFGCPYRYQQVYVLRKKEVKTLPLALGSLIHDIAAEYFATCATFKDTSHSRLDAIVSDKWFTRDTLIEQSSRDDLDLFVSNLRDYPIDPQRIAAMEQRLALTENLTITAWSATDVAYGGIMDLVTMEGQGLQITDWTTAAISGAHGNEKDFQLRFYGWLLYTYAGLQPEHSPLLRRRNEIEVRTKSLRTGKEVCVQLTEGDHEKTWERIESERQRILTFIEDDGPWDACAGSLCGICRLECPLEQKEGAPMVRLLDEADASAAHQRLIIIEREAKALKALLKGYVGVHGSVVSNGIEARIDPTERVSYPDTHAVLELLGRAGYSPRDCDDVTKIDRTALKKLLKKDGDTWAEVDELASVEISERFSAVASVRGK